MSVLDINKKSEKKLKMLQIVEFQNKNSQPVFMEGETDNVSSQTIRKVIKLF